MTVLLFLIFWIRSVQNGSNLIKLDQIGFSQQSKNVTIKSCHIYRKDKNGCFIWFFRIRSVQNGSNLIKIDQIGFLTNQKMLLLKRIKMAVLFLIFLDQICPKWIKLDQIGFPPQSKNYRKDKMAVLFLIFLDQICPKWIKLDQTWSNWISSPI